MAQFDDTQHGKRHFQHKPEQEDRGSYIPSPAEIKRQCLKFQAGWSAYERAVRCVHPVDPVSVARSFESSMGRSGVYRRHYSVEGDR